MSSNDRKRKKAYFAKGQPKKKSNYMRPLEAGMRGFLFTCNKKQREATRDAYAILNEFADKLFGPEQVPVATDDDECDDIEAAIRKEVEEAKKQNKSDTRRFQAVDTGGHDCLFIKTTLSDPNTLSDAIYEDLLATQTAKTRHVMKFFPVVGSCKCDTKRIRDFVLDMISEQFKGIQEFTYSVHIRIRFNSGFTKSAILPIVTNVIREIKPLATVKLAQHEYAISINVVKHVFMLSVLKKFDTYKKYNLQEMTLVQCDAATEDANGEGSEEKLLGDDDDVKGFVEEVQENEEG